MKTSPAHVAGAALSSLLLLLSSPAGAEPAKKSSPTKPAAKPAAKPIKAARPSAEAVAKPAEPAPPLSPGQLDVVDRVLTGMADCEFKQQISVLPVQGQHGHFEVRFQKARYVMAPRETATGAVRLEDPQTGMLWIQIPSKSMLMDSRRGQRVVDHCLHSEQRAALAAVKDAAESLGIAPGGAATASTAASAPDSAAPNPPTASLPASRQP